MLETPNTRASEIFPVWILPNGDDGKRKPFHVIHCLAQPKCNAELRLSPGRHSRLPPEAIVKYAGQKDWFADRRGYALCPLHRPGSKLRPPSDMPPAQKRAAFIAIRERNIAAAAVPSLDADAVALRSLCGQIYELFDDPDARTISYDEIATKLGASVETVRSAVALMLELGLAVPNGRNATLSDLSPDEYRERLGVFCPTTTKPPAAPSTQAPKSTRLKRMAVDRLKVLRFLKGRVAPASVAEVAEALSLSESSARTALLRLLARGRVCRVGSGKAYRPFLYSLSPSQEESAAMPSSAMPLETVPETAPVKPPKVDPPRSPSLEDNRQIRDFLDGNFDEAAGRWKGSLSDERAAAGMQIPRAWVSALRSSLYGPDDRNEADEKADAVAEELARRLEKLKEDGLAMATRAEALEREVRRFLDGRR